MRMSRKQFERIFGTSPIFTLSDPLLFELYVKAVYKLAKLLLVEPDKPQPKDCESESL